MSLVILPLGIFILVGLSVAIAVPLVVASRKRDDDKGPRDS